VSVSRSRSCFPRREKGWTPMSTTVIDARPIPRYPVFAGVCLDFSEMATT
jgi:hypothetical protein